MNRDWIKNDRVIINMDHVVETCSNAYNIEVLSIVLYGSRAKGDRNSQNDYEIMILINDESSLKNYIEFTNLIRLELLKQKFFNVKIYVYTPGVFEDILYNDKIIGTFLYMICKENIILYDKFGTFTAIREKLMNNNIKGEEVFLAQCVEFARMLGSEKWAQKWEKTLMQFKYLKKRREY
ncbi:MAG: nucleotidyltransferase domain-containing protein [Clostridia bacterium]|nr:nucleotidyltransferase domain-containing protein [Clostridia bacterium]